MSSSITIRIKVNGGFLVVEQGKGKWLNKIATAGIGAFIFLPLIATAGIGVFLQDKMQKDVFKFISEYLEHNGCTLIHAYVVNNDQEGAIESKYNCPNCKKEIGINSKFCNECGIPLTKTCPKCNTENPFDFKFCRECGSIF